MTQLRLSATLALLGAAVILAGTLGPWSTIGDDAYRGVDGAGSLDLALAVGVGIAATLTLVSAPVAPAARWVVLALAVLALVFTIAVVVQTVTSSADDVAQTTGPLLTREAAWGLWVSLAGAVVATVGGALAILAPAPEPSRTRTT